MENTQVEGEVVVQKKNVFFEVTTLSKTLAAVLFIILPFIGFYIGTKYSKEINSDVQTAITPVQDNQMQTPQNSIATEVTNKMPVGLELPENSTWVSAQTGVFKGYLSKKVLGRDEVLGYLAEGETITCDTFTITEGDLSMFYKHTGEDTYSTITQNELPYEIYIGDGDMKTLPEMTQNVLLKSSPATPVFAVITEYFSSAGKGLDTCESEVEIFNAI